MHGASDYYNTRIRDTGSSNLLLSRCSRLLVARKQSLARFNAVTSLGDTGKDNQRIERKFTNQSIAIGENRSSEKRRVMFSLFRKKQRTEEEALIKKTGNDLVIAAEKAVKEAKIAQDVIIANGFTLALLNIMGGKHD